MCHQINHDIDSKGIASRLLTRFFMIVSAVPVFCMLWAVSGHAGDVALSWDVNSTADYYEVYWGTTSGTIEGQSGNIGKVTTYKVTGLQDGKTYYFSVKAFNNCGNSSDFSDWVATTVEASQVPPSDESLVEDDGGVVADSNNPSEDTVVDNDISAEAASPVSPGEKSVDGYVPQANVLFVEDRSERPTLEVLDTHFQHLFWLRAGWSDYNDLNGESRVVRGDIDHDGVDELVIGYAPVDSDPLIPGGFFQVIDDDYSHLGWGRVEWGDYNTLNGETRPTCGDIDGDGDDEIIIGLGPHGKGYMEVFDFIDGTVTHQAWLQVNWQEYNEMHGEVRPVCGDMDGDGVDEIIAGLSSDSGTAEIPGGKFEAFSFDTVAWSHLLWGTVAWPAYNEINGETWPEFGDLDGDGENELVVGLGYGSEGQMAIFEFQNGSAVQTEWAQIEWPEYNELTGETRPVCGDIDFDGKDDVIIGWNTPDGESGRATYFKVLSYSIAAKALESFKTTESTDVDIDSAPVKGALTKNETIVMGLSKPLAKGGETELPYTDTAVESNSIPGSGGGEGCFIRSGQ